MHLFYELKNGSTNVRCVTAIMEKEAYFLPDPDKQKVAAKVLFDNFKVPNVVVAGDGTYFH